MTMAFHSFSLFLPLFFCYMPNASLYNFLFFFSLLIYQASWRLLLDLSGEIPLSCVHLLFLLLSFPIFFPLLSFDLLSLTRLNIYAV